MRGRFGWALGVALCVQQAAAAQPVVGYQLGLTESLSATYGDDLNTLTGAVQQPVDANNPPARPVDPKALARELRGLQGLVSDTTASGTLTLDLIGTHYDQGLLLSASMSQIVPSLVPDLPAGVPAESQYALRENTTTGRVAVEYLGLARIGRRRLRLRLFYHLLANGRLEAGPNGGYQGNTQVSAAYPTASAGIFGFNALTHEAGAALEHHIRHRTWGLRSRLRYGFTKNGVYSLSAGAVGAVHSSGNSSNIGAFVQSNIHTIVWGLELEVDLSPRDALVVSQTKTWTLPEDLDLDANAAAGSAVAAVPKTTLQDAEARWEHRLTAERVAGLSFGLNYNRRAPFDADGRPLPDAHVTADTLILTPQAFYRDHLLRWELQLNASAGLARASLYQPPIGAEADRDTFQTVHSAWQPVFNLALTRRFEPVDVTLNASRTVGAGALGASAVLVDAAEVVARYQVPRLRVVFTAGANVNHTQGVDKDKFRSSRAQDILRMAAFNSWGAGARFGVLVPLIQRQQLSLDLQAGYLYTWADTDPDQRLHIPPTDAHTGVVALRMLYGRGAAQDASGAGGRGEGAELSPYGADPRTGAPLLSSQFYSPDPDGPTHPVPQDAQQDPNASPRSYRQAQAANPAAQGVAAGSSGQVQAVGSSEQEARRREANRSRAAQRRRDGQLPPTGAEDEDGEDEDGEDGDD